MFWEKRITQFWVVTSDLESCGEGRARSTLGSSNSFPKSQIILQGCLIIFYWFFRHTCDDPLKHKTVPTLYKHKWKKGPNYVTFGNLVIGPSFVPNFQGSRTNTLNNPLEIPHIPVISSTNSQSQPKYQVYAQNPA